MELKMKIKQAPLQPGCYLFKDADGRIIYVGKAKVIRNRVKQYFMKTNQQDDKGLLLAKLICDVEFRITPTERDALMEEYRLIKQYRPWFNVQHKKDRPQNYYLILNRSGRYPAFEITTQAGCHPKDIIGRFRSEGRAREAVMMFNRTFRTPVCSHRFETVSEPCLHYQVGRCLGPCIGRISTESYDAVIKDIIRLMQGKTCSAVKELKKELMARARCLEFEKAAVLKEQIGELEQLRGRAGKLTIPVDRDVILAIRAFREESFSLFYLQKGRIRKRAEFGGRIDKEKLIDFLDQQEEAEMTVTRTCLEEIAADRRLILLPGDKDREKRCRTVERNLLEWI